MILLYDYIVSCVKDRLKRIQNGPNAESYCNSKILRTVIDIFFFYVPLGSRRHLLRHQPSKGRTLRLTQMYYPDRESRRVHTTMILKGTAKPKTERETKPIPPLGGGPVRCCWAAEDVLQLFLDGGRAGGSHDGTRSRESEVRKGSRMGHSARCKDDGNREQTSSPSGSRQSSVGRPHEHKFATLAKTQICISGSRKVYEYR